MSRSKPSLSYASERFCPRSTLQKCTPGPAHVCERCMSMGLETCIYKQIKKRGIGKTLRMGEACKRCRSVTPQSAGFWAGTLTSDRWTVQGKEKGE